MKKLIVIVSVLVVICLVVLFAAGYFLGNIPVISGLLGTNKAVDLGAEISLEQSYAGLEALKTTLALQHSLQQSLQKAVRSLEFRYRL